MATFFRVMLYSVLAAMIGVNLYFFLYNGKKQAAIASSPPPVHIASDAPLAIPPPPVPVSTPPVNEIIRVIDDNSSLVQSAKERFEKGDFRKSSELCKQLAEKDKKALLCVGLSYFKLSNYEDSIAFLEPALENGADEFTCRKCLAFAYYYRDNFDKRRSCAVKIN